jgi:hypothetical protein
VSRILACGLVVGLTVGFALTQSTVTGLAPPAFAGSLMLAALVVATRLPRPARSTARVASLDLRRVRDYVPRRPAFGVVALAATAIGAIGAIGLHGLLARPDLPPDYYDTGWYGPFSEYGPWAGHGLGGLLASTLATVVVAVGSGGLALWLLVRSPSAGADADERRHDEVWRRRTAHLVVATTGVNVAVPVAVVGFLVATTPDVGDGFLGAVATVVVPSLVGVLALQAGAGYARMLLRPPSFATAAPSSTGSASPSPSRSASPGATPG